MYEITTVTAEGVVIGRSTCTERELDVQLRIIARIAYIEKGERTVYRRIS